MADYVNELSDPAAFQDMQEQQLELLRQTKLAELLRKQAGFPGGITDMPQGQMVSGHYIAPHWTQRFAAVANPLIQQYQAKQAEEQQVQKQHALRQAVAQAQQQWMSQMPQGSPGTPEVPGQSAMPEQQGNNPSAYVAPQAAVPGVPAVAPKLPSAMERMKWLARGSMIPGNEKIAGAASNIMEGEVNREDRQAELAAQGKLQREQKQADMIMTFAQQERLAREKAADTRLNEQERNAAKIEAARIAQETRAMMAAMTQGHQNDTLELRKATALQGELTRLGTVVQPLQGLSSAADRVQQTLDKYKDQKVPGIGHAAWVPAFLRGNEATQNQAAVAGFAQALIQMQAGLSQTLSEQELTKATLLSSGSFSEKDFKENWPWMVKRYNDTIETIKAAHGRPLLPGMPSAWDVYQQQGGKFKPIQSTWGDAPKAEVQGPKSKLPKATGQDRPLTPAEQAEYDARVKAQPGGTW